MTAKPKHLAHMNSLSFRFNGHFFQVDLKTVVDYYVSHSDQGSSFYLADTQTRIVTDGRAHDSG